MSMISHKQDLLSSPARLDRQKPEANDTTMKRNCRNCGQPFAATAEQIGTMVACPVCGYRFVLPPKTASSWSSGSKWSAWLVVAVIVIAAAFGISVSTSSKPSVPKGQEMSAPIERRPANGAELEAPSLQLGLGTLTVVNGTDSDAAVKLIPMHSNQAVRFVYVHANDRWTIEGVPEGTFRLRFTQGRDWDAISKVFRRNVSYREFDRPLDYVEIITVGGVRYQTHEVTLQHVPSGNAPTRSVQASEF